MDNPTHDPSPLTLHLIEAAGMKADIENLKHEGVAANERLLDVLREMSTDLKALRMDLGTVPRQIDSCRQDMRREVERDFPTKSEALQMEQRIEKQIADTDKTLGKQISDVDKKIDAKMAEVTVQITKVDTKLNNLWIRLSMVMLTLIAAGGVVQWILLTYKAGRDIAG